MKNRNEEVPDMADVFKNQGYIKQILSSRNTKKIYEETLPKIRELFPEKNGHG